MTTPLVSISNLSKSYRVYSHASGMIVEALTGRVRHREFLALDDISFDVEPGSVVGLLGRNGAGKSTLLRIVARTLDATSGTVVTNGRIAAILELGTGFHPEYTGRENIYFGGICLGLSRREMHERLDEIIAFSELEAFIDQPFRTYSSGMQARLTFSVATCVDPDILIVDEALAVGDAKFQLKSFDRIRQFKRRGKAILLVSHSINQIAAFCDHAVLLDHGKMLAQGDPNKVGNIYHELLFGPPEGAAAIAAAAIEAPALPSPTCPITPGVIESLPECISEEAGADTGESLGALGISGSKTTGEEATPALGPPTTAYTPDGVAAPQPWASPGAPVSAREHRYGNGDARVIAAEIRDLQGRVRNRLRSLETYELHLTIQIYRAVPSLCYGFVLRDARGLDLFGGDSRYYLPEDPRLGLQRPGTVVRAKARFRANLAAGRYFLTIGIACIDETKCDVRFDAIELTVEATPGLFHNSLVNLETKYELLEEETVNSNT